MSKPHHECCNCVDCADWAIGEARRWRNLAMNYVDEIREHRARWENLQAEVERLRKIERVAKAVVANYRGLESNDEVKLRDALEASE